MPILVEKNLIMSLCKPENNMITLVKPAALWSGLEDGTGLKGSCSSY